MSEPMKEPALTRADRELQDALARLAPTSAGISRDETLFEAGRASAPQPNVRFWKIAASGMLLITIGAICFRSERIVDRPVERIVRVYENKQEPRPATTAAPVTLAQYGNAEQAPQMTLTNLPADSYYCLRNDMLRHVLQPAPAQREDNSDAPKAGETSEPLWRLRLKDMGGAF